jgi:predicted Ser/Thr protein kinase
MSKITQPDELLGLKPLVEESVPLWDFLKSLKEHPERVDTAAARLVRAVKEKGIIKPEEVDPDRRPYIQLLTDMKIPVYRVFDQVRGVQRFAQRLMAHYESAAKNGYQMRQALVLLSGPGAGKTMLGDALSEVLEGEDIWVVEGCPIGESPINLLTLLPKDQLIKISDTLGMRSEVDGVLVDKLEELLRTAQPPCEHCFKTVMGVGADSSDAKNPNLSKVMVQRIRMSSRTRGVAVWSPPAETEAANCHLHGALVQANRGLVRLLEAFSANGVKQGSVSELSLLLEATDSRRIPSNGGAECIAHTSGWTHLDENIVIESNPGAWKAFLEAQPDRAAYLRRTRVLYMPYNTSVSEEVQAYKDALRNLKAKPEFDPLALRMMSILAVASRMANDSKAGGIDLATRVRLYDGEPIVLGKTVSGVGDKPNPYSNYGSALSTSSGGSSSGSGEQRTMTVEDIWRLAGDDEGKTGLNMGFMLAALSRVCEAVMSTPKKVGPALTVMGMLMTIIEMASKVPDISREEKETYERCLKLLKPLGTKTKAEPDGESMLEGEYRRLLRKQFLSVFAPDYEARANGLSDQYWAHAIASARGQEVMDPETKRKLSVDVPFLSKLEAAMGKSVDDAARFRGSLVTEKAQLIQAQLEREAKTGAKSDGSLKITWDMHPEIKKGISKILDEDIATKVSKLLNTEFGLTEEEVKLRDESIERLKALGYSETTLEVALRYFKDNELWKSA